MSDCSSRRVSKLTIDFGNGFVRTLAMKRTDDRTWTIRVDYGKRIQFQFAVLQIEAHPNCSYDRLEMVEREAINQSMFIS